MRNTIYHPIKSSLRKKMVIGFIVFISIPILFFEMVLFQSWLGTTRNIVVNQYETILNDSIASLMQNVVTIERMNDYLYRDYQTEPVLFEKLTSGSDGPTLRSDPYLNAVFTQLSRQFFSQADDEITFSFFSMDGDLIYQRSNSPGRAQFLSLVSNYKEEAWFQQVADNGPVNTVLPAHRSFFQLEDTSIYFSFGQVIRSPFDLLPAGISMLTVDASLFAKLLKSPSDNELIKTVVTSLDGRRVYTNDPEDHIPVHSSHIFHQQLDPYAWEVSAYLSSERLSQSYIVGMIRNNGLFVVANFVMLAAIIGFLTRQLKPLYVLADKMRKAKEGHFHVKIVQSSTDELGMLSEIFNEMTTEIKRLFENQQKDYQEKLAFQMKSLESQINPHFIYNMLDLIQSRVYEDNPDKASDLIVALSVIMRYTTTRPGEKVTCAEEIKWLRDYLFLQQQLFGERVDVRLDFDDRIMSCKVHKLILQPIIENAFIHGFEPGRSGNRLLIRGYREDGFLVFEVRDDGRGFAEPVDLHLTRDNVDGLKEWGTGLYVTAQRFLLQSDQASIHLQSVPGGGTSVVMKQFCMSETQIP